MTRTPLLLTLVAAAAIAGCDGEGQTIVIGPEGDPANQAPAVNGPVTLPPSIVASKTYRCRDNSLVSIDWLSDDTANFRPQDGTAPVHLTGAGEGDELVAEGGYSLSGDPAASDITITTPGEGTRSCHV